MKRVFLMLMTLVVGIALGLTGGAGMRQVRAADPSMTTSSAGPTLEAVQALALLVTMKVAVSDVQVTRMQGYTGAAKAALLVRGDFILGADLKRARFAKIDPSAKAVELVLQLPTASNPRVDLSRTRLVDLGTEGLWELVPNRTVELTVTDEAYRDAQQTVERVSRESQWQEQARQQAESVLRTFFGSIGWTVNVEWTSDGPPKSSWSSS